MTRERIWFIFTILVVFVLVIAFVTHKTSKTYNEQQYHVDSEEEYVVDEVLPTSDIDLNTAAVGSSGDVVDTIRPGNVGEGCFVGGCSNQICTDVEEVVSDCRWHETYACYNGEVCEVQPDGECGWTRTEKIMQCIAEIIPDLALYIK